MYCSGCGAQIQQGLNYCSRWGRRVAEDEAAFRSISKNPFALSAMTAGVGFLAFMFVVRMLSKAEFPATLYVPITAIYFTALFGICFMLMRYGTRAAVEKRQAVETTYEPTPLYVNPASAEQLTAGQPSEVGSVTDATTRTLDKVPIYRE